MKRFILSVALLLVAATARADETSDRLTKLEAQLADLKAQVAALAEQRQAAAEWERSYNAAVSESRPLMVWVGYNCPSSAGQVPGFLHLHVATPWRDVTGQGVVVLLPDGKGKLYRAAVVPSDQVCAANLRGVVEQAAREAEIAATMPAVVQSLRGWSTSRDGACPT